MKQLVSLLLLAVCSIFAAAGDTTSSTSYSTGCSTWTTTSATTWLADIVVANIDPASAVTAWTTRVFSGPTTTYAFTEPVVTDATSTTVVSTITMLVAAYNDETIIQCGTSTSTIPGSTTSTSPVATVTPSPSASSSSGDGSGSATTVICDTNCSSVPASVVATGSQSSSTSSTCSGSGSPCPATSISSLTAGTATSTSSNASPSSTVHFSQTIASRTSSESTNTGTGIWSESVGRSSSSSLDIWGPYSSSTSTGTSDWAIYTPSTVAATPSLPTDATIVSLSDSQSSTTSSASAPSATSNTTTTSNTTAPVIVPLYTAQFDNVTYYIPSCSEPTQTLWRSDGSNFTLSCNNLILSSGDVIPVPQDPPQGTCQTTTVNGSSACFARRFDWEASDDSITCQYTAETKRDAGSIYANLTAIADALALVKDVTSAASTVEQGVAHVGCAAQQALEGVSAYYFNSVQKEFNVNLALELLSEISTFFTSILGLNRKVTEPVNIWIDEVDTQFQALACYMNTDNGRQTLIWRTLTKHTTFHAGLNTLASLNNVVQVNAITTLIEEVLRTVFTGMITSFEQYITSSGSIIQGWTQAWRICSTKWDIDSLDNPEQEPDEDDEDDWLPRYQIFTTPEASMTQLQALEHALGGGGWEISSSNATHWIKGYVVDLNIMQSLLPKTMDFINSTYRFVWDGSSATSSIYPDTPDDATGTTTGTTGTKRSGFRASREKALRDNNNNHTNLRKRDFDPTSFEEPTGSNKLAVSAGHYLKLLSQQKGQDPNSYTDYTYADPQGQGTWIVIIDSGFDLTHARLQATSDRQVVQYVVPNTMALPKLSLWEQEQGWTEAAAVIDDNLPDDEAYGHGTGVACVAAGLGTGVAPRANLLLVKLENYFVNTRTGEKRQPGLTLSGLQDAFTGIRDHFAGLGAFTYGKRVINFSMVLAGDSGCGWFLEYFFQSMDLEGTTIVMAAGNEGYSYLENRVLRYQAEISPQKLATSSSPYITVGATYHDGSLWEWTTPAGARPGSSAPSSDAAISVWAQGDDVLTCDANGAADAMRLREGTSFAAPQMAGLVAYMLSYPWASSDEDEKTKNPFAFARPAGDGSVGTRAKEMIAGYYAYQRLPPSEITNQALKTLEGFQPPRAFPWPVPEKVDVIYNMAFGAQKCRAVEGLPNVKARRGDGVCLMPGATTGTTTSDASVSYETASPTYESDTWTGFATGTGILTTDSIPTETGSSDTNTNTDTISSSSSSSSSSSTSLVTASYTLTLGATTTTLPTTTVASATAQTTAWVTATVSTTNGQTTLTVTQAPPTITPTPTPATTTTSSTSTSYICTSTYESECCPYANDQCEGSGGTGDQDLDPNCCVRYTASLLGGNDKMYMYRTVAGY